MPEQLWFTEFLNHHFGAITTALLRHLGIQPAYPNAPINNAIAMELLVIFVLLMFFVAVRASLSVEKPGGLQHTAEAVQEFVAEQAHGVIGHGYERYLPYAITVGYFILLSNLLGLIPGFDSPTVFMPTCLPLTWSRYRFFRSYRFWFQSLSSDYTFSCPWCRHSFLLCSRWSTWVWLSARSTRHVSVLLHAASVRTPSPRTDVNHPLAANS